MADNFVGEIRVVAFNFAPQGWAICDGSILPIAQYTALFSLLGTQYGGNGVSNFALPNLLGRVAIGQGQGPGLSDYVPGEEGGTETVTLLYSEMPAHSHNLPSGSGTATTGDPTKGTYATPNISPRFQDLYRAAVTNQTANPNMVAPTGGNTPHDNIQPYQSNMVIIALQGIFPSRG